MTREDLAEKFRDCAAGVLRTRFPRPDGVEELGIAGRRGEP